nr:hypothetical protein [Thalassobius sp. Cn5-15]
MLVAIPFLLLPVGLGDATALVVLLAALAGLMTFLEYATHYPSVLEFRDAPPLNRLRFAAAFLVVLVLSLILRVDYVPTQLGLLLQALGQRLGDLADFPYSPVRLALLAMPADSPQALIDIVRMATAVAYTLAGAVLLLFLLILHFTAWPVRGGGFNVWVNLPMFDPTKGDVLVRLQRDARINVMLGFILPFLLPAVLKGLAGWVDLKVLMNPHVLIWCMMIWACLPANMILRGVAIGRVADMIDEKRRRTYAEAKVIDTV